METIITDLGSALESYLEGESDLEAIENVTGLLISHDDFDSLPDYVQEEIYVLQLSM